jgi:hypothetical protein
LECIDVEDMYDIMREAQKQLNNNGINDVLASITYKEEDTSEPVFQSDEEFLVFDEEIEESESEKGEDKKEKFRENNVKNNSKSTNV